jgi:hypothetical protein
VEQRVREMRDTGRAFNREQLAADLQAQGLDVGRTTLERAKSAVEARLDAELHSAEDTDEAAQSEPEPEAEPELCHRCGGTGYEPVAQHD